MNWIKFLPEPESQIIGGVDSMRCTVFATIDAIQILLCRGGFECVEYDEVPTSLLAGVSKSGSNPQWVAEVIRRNGLYPREAHPQVGLALSEKEQRAIARQWLERYVFRYFEVKDVSKALQVSPVGVAVHAWVESDGVYLDIGAPVNHWTLIVDEEKDWWVCWDSIEPNLKKISKEYKFSYALGYTVRARQGGLLSSIIKGIYGRLLLYKKSRQAN